MTSDSSSWSRLPWVEKEAFCNQDFAHVLQDRFTESEDELPDPEGNQQQF